MNKLRKLEQRTLASISTTVPILLVTMALGTTSLHAQTSPVPEASPDPHLKDTTFHSNIMSEDRRVIIHLPRKYEQDTGTKYPVMYVLDGTSQDQHTADQVIVLSDAGLIPAAIVIGLPNTRGNRERDQTPPFMRTNIDDSNSPYGLGNKFLDFIEKELIPHIDHGYRTSGYRMIAGNSRGGLFVLYTLLERPDLFQARFCFSTPVWRFDDLILKKLDEFLRSAKKRESFLYMAVGDKETDQITGGFTRMATILNKGSRNKLTWVGDRTPYADHQDNALIATSKGLAEWGKYLHGKKKIGGAAH
jgi:predicted alpha/beta superfamily hydrolase